MTTRDEWAAGLSPEHKAFMVNMIVEGIVVGLDIRETLDREQRDLEYLVKEFMEELNDDA